MSPQKIRPDMKEQGIQAEEENYRIKQDDRETKQQQTNKDNMKPTMNNEMNNETIEQEIMQQDNTIDTTRIYKIKRTKRRREKRRNRRKSRATRYSRSNSNNHETNTVNNRQYEDESKTWGNELEINEEWMGNTSTQQILRIVHYNTNGIPPDGEFIKWETILHSMDDIQADIFCLNETKLDTQNSSTYFTIQQIAKQKDQRMNVQMNSSLQTPNTRDSVFKPGGTMVCVRGQWSGRKMHIKNDPAIDPPGRWTVAHIKGKGNTIISVFSVYRVCANDTGENTTYVQQQNDLYEKHKRIIDPQQRFIKDLKNVIVQLTQNNHKIIISADINNDAGYEFNNHWNTMMKEARLRNIIQI